MINELKDLSGNLTLKEMAYNSIKTLIIDGTLLPDSKLNELELSRSMNISRGPIREALSMLVRDGFAYELPRRGTVVSSVKEEDILQIWGVRCVLEEYALEISKKKIPKENILYMIELIQKTEKTSPTNLESYKQNDDMLHTLLYKYSGNSYLNHILNGVQEHCLRIRYYAESSQTGWTTVVQETTIEHLQILWALNENDYDQAKIFLKQHLENVKNRILIEYRKLS